MSFLLFIWVSLKNGTLRDHSFMIPDAYFRNTGLERSSKLAKDLEWFKEQGYTIPGPSEPGLTYTRYLEELSEKDPQAFICHFYNVYFAHSAGGRMIGKKVTSYNMNFCCCWFFFILCLIAVCPVVEVE